MAFFRRSAPRPASEKIENVIGPSAEFSGDLKAEGGFRIDGVVRGTVESQSNVIIGETARVIADVSGFNITVAGYVEGNVTAIGRLEILSTGRVAGGVQAGSFLIEEGGVFHGQSVMDSDENAPPAEKKRLLEPPATGRQDDRNSPEAKRQDPQMMSQERS